MTDRLVTPRARGMSRRLLAAMPLASLLPSLPGCSRAAASELESRAIPARLLPVPGTVSPELQQRVAAAYPPGWDTVPQTAAAWREMAAQSAAAVAPHLPAIRQQLGVRVEADQIAGVPVFVAAPVEMPPANRDRLLLHVHGGGYVLYPGEAGAGEAMLMAGYGRFRVISVDYRMAPDSPFPAALDDAMAVWRALLANQDSRRMAIFGSLAGGGLTLAMVLRAKAEGLPLPAAIAPGTPWSDLTGAGDSVRDQRLRRQRSCVERGLGGGRGRAVRRRPQPPRSSPLANLRGLQGVPPGDSDIRNARSVPQPHGADPPQAAASGC